MVRCMRAQQERNMQASRKRRKIEKERRREKEKEEELFSYPKPAISRCVHMVAVREGRRVIVGDNEIEYNI